MPVRVPVRPAGWGSGEAARLLPAEVVPVLPLRLGPVSERLMLGGPPAHVGRAPAAGQAREVVSFQTVCRARKVFAAARRVAGVRPGVIEVWCSQPKPAPSVRLPRDRGAVLHKELLVMRLEAPSRACVAGDPSGTAGRCLSCSKELSCKKGNAYQNL